MKPNLPPQSKHIKAGASESAARSLLHEPSAVMKEEAVAHRHVRMHAHMPHAAYLRWPPV